MDTGLGLLERWLLRQGEDHSIPSTIPVALERLQSTVSNLRSLADLLPPDEYPVRLTPDTNALIDNPDLAIYTSELGSRYMTHLLPVVLGEIDNLKRAGRTPELRQCADRANKRLKGLRNNGDVRAGVRVEGDVYAIFEHVEPRSDLLPSWLDTTVPDDRFVASALLLQSQHPGSALYVATSDINMQTKLSAVGIPFVEPALPADHLPYAPPPTARLATDRSGLSAEQKGLASRVGLCLLGGLDVPRGSGQKLIER